MTKALTLLSMFLSFALFGCEEADLPFSITSPAGNSILVPAGSTNYDETLKYLENIEASKTDDSYVLTEVQYLELLSQIGGGMTVEEGRKRDLWHEQYFHWDNLDVMDVRMDSIYEDEVVDLEESVFICSVSDQWLDQLREAQYYVAEFTEFAPTMVEANGDIIPNLADAAAEREDVLLPVIQVCDR